MAQDEAEDRYFTQVDAGDVRLFTLDQLDAAFNAGLIHENTYVCLEGDSQWLTLGEVAGLGEEAEPAPISAQVATPHYAASTSVLPAQHLPAVMIAPSIAPVVNDLAFSDFDTDLMSMRPKRRTGKVVAGLAVVALGALGFLVVQSGGLRGLKLPGGLDKLAGQNAAASLSMSTLNEPSSASQPKLQAAPTPAAPEPAKVEPTKVVEPSASNSELEKDKPEPTAKKNDDRFSDDMKAALLAKDKQQASAQKSKKAARAATASKQRIAKSSKGKGAGGFKSGGNAYDPLNGKL
jgi:hypothetical protein